MQHNPPFRKGYKLNEAGETLYDDWQAYNSSYGCSCHLAPPCSNCVHPGHPICLESTDDVWEKEQTEIDYLSINKEFSN